MRTVVSVMALDRGEGLRKAEKLLRQGRLEAAIAEYVRLVDDHPRDWTTANTLGDLYVRAGQLDDAVAQYTRVADHLFREGFLPKAAALLKKIVKIAPTDEASQLKLAEISAHQGLLADAKAYLAVVAELRRRRGDEQAAHEIALRRGDLDPSDLEARLGAAQAARALGDVAGAVARLHAIASDLVEKGRPEAALKVWREIARIDAGDAKSRTALAEAYLAAGNLTAAREFLSDDVVAASPPLLLASAEVALRDRRLEEGRTFLARALLTDASTRNRIVELGGSLRAVDADAAFVCAEVAAEDAAARGEWTDAATILHEFINRVSDHIPALLRLIEVCVDGGLEETMYVAQAGLAEAYLALGRAEEARVIAEDLVAREPWDSAHIERYRRSLVQLGEPDPDRVIAQRLGAEEASLGAEEALEPIETEPLDEAALTPAGPDEVPEAAEPDTAELDLTSLLDDLVAADAAVEVRTDRAAGVADSPPSGPPVRAELEEVFEGFRDEVSSQTMGERAAEEYRLGRALYDMGMRDEAVTFLTAAARDPQLRFQAAALLGRLCMQNGMTTSAVEWFERAAEAPAPTMEEGRGLLYDLGVILESAGETARALAVFLELQAEAGEYRDVGARVDRLARVQAGG